VVLRSGRLGVVSSFTNPEGDLTQSVVGLGTAPVLEGGRAAVSLQLSQKGSVLLWQSMQSATPDVSFMFEMDMAGYRSPKRAVVEAQMDRIYSHQSFDLGVATTYLESEIKTAYEDLFQSGAIKLTQVGDDQQLDALVQTAYSKLTELIFQPAANAQAQAATGSTKSALDRASELLDKRRKEVREDNARAAAVIAAANKDALQLREAAKTARSEKPANPGDDPQGRAEYLEALAVMADRVKTALEQDAPNGGGGVGKTPALQPLPEFAAVSIYEMKQTRQRGVYKIDLNKYTADNLALRFDRNIGDLSRYLDDPKVFRSVNVDDPMYRQRNVVASLSGVNAAAFDSLLDFVGIQVRKVHQGGEETLEERNVDRNTFSQQGNRFEVVYGWKDDTDRRKWEQFEYRALWGFRDLGSVQEEWQKTDAPLIQLRAPFVTREIELDAGDGTSLSGAGVRSVSVQVFVPFGSGEVKRQETLNVARGELSKKLSVAVPRDVSRYAYEIRWNLKGNQTRSSGRLESDQDLLYLDEVPAESAAAPAATGS
jgi:hypothetical protein